MKRFLIPLLLLVSLAVRAGVPVAWVDGVVVLKNREVMVGKLVLQPALDIILFRAGDKSTYFPVGHVQYVRFHDKRNGLIRKFVAHAETAGGQEVYHLYETVVEGPLSVIRKPKGGLVPDVADPYGFEYFILHGQEMMELASFREKIYPLIESFYGRKYLRDLIRNEKLDPDEAAGAIRLIDRYNEQLRLFNKLSPAS